VLDVKETFASRPDWSVQDAMMQSVIAEFPHAAPAPLTGLFRLRRQQH
jgi:hypothetical protein